MRTPEFLTMMTIGNFPWPRECQRPNHYALRLSLEPMPAPHNENAQNVGWELEIGLTRQDQYVFAIQTKGSILLDRIIAQAIVSYVELATKEVPGGQVRIPFPAALSMVRGILDKVVEMKESEQ